MRKLLTISLLIFALALSCPAQTTPAQADNDWPVFVTANVGFSRYTNPTIQGGAGVGLRIAANFYALTEMNLAGGSGAFIEDALFRVACRSYLCLWARGGGGLDTTTTNGSTVTTASFGGGGMMTYDIGARFPKLSGLLVGGSIKAMRMTEAGVSVVRPQFQTNLIFTFPSKQ